MGKRGRGSGGAEAAPGVAPLACVLQVGSQSTAFRTRELFGGAYAGCDLEHLFPIRFRGSRATELGPRTAHKGPCMVLLRGMKASPEEFTAFVQGHPFLPHYIHRVYWVDLGRPGVARGELAAAVAQRWAEGGWGGGARLQVHPKQGERAVAEDLHAAGAGPECVVRGYSAVVSALPLDAEREVLMTGEAALYLVGVHSAASLYVHPCDVAKLSQGPSKAQSKLDEALLILGDLPGGNAAAVDLGAAPGAWTAALARRFNRVFAVDPAELDADVLALENVTHLQMKAENAVGELRARLPPPAGGGETGDAPPGSWGAGLLVCDMNCGLHEVGAAVQGALPLLQSGARVVVTLKLRGRGRDTAERAAILAKALGAGVRMLDTVFLMGNTNHERCFLGVKV